MMKHTAKLGMLAMLVATVSARAEICIVQKGGCQDIASGKVYEQQGSAYVDPETKEVKIAPPKEYETTYPGKPGSGGSGSHSGIKVRLEKKP